MGCFNISWWFLNILLLVLSGLLILVDLGVIVAFEISDGTESASIPTMGITSNLIFNIIISVALCGIIVVGIIGFNKESFILLLIYTVGMAVVILLTMGFMFKVCYNISHVRGYLQPLFDGYKDDESNKKIMDNLHEQYSCCGIDDYKDWGETFIPDSCCYDDDDEDNHKNSTKERWSPDWEWEVGVEYALCKKTLNVNYVYKHGCLENVQNKYTEFAIGYTVVGLLYCFLYIATLTLGAYKCYQVRKGAGNE